MRTSKFEVKTSILVVLWFQRVPQIFGVRTPTVLLTVLISGQCQTRYLPWVGGGGSGWLVGHHNVENSRAREAPKPQNLNRSALAATGPHTISLKISQF